MCPARGRGEPGGFAGKKRKETVKKIIHIHNKNKNTQPVYMYFYFIIIIISGLLFFFVFFFQAAVFIFGGSFHRRRCHCALRKTKHARQMENSKESF